MRAEDLPAADGSAGPGAPAPAAPAGDADREDATRMVLAIEGSGTGIWDRDVHANRMHYSKGWKAILGYAESEITGSMDEAYKRIHPDELAYVQAAMQAHFDGKTDSYEVEHRLRCKDGSYKWVCSRGKVVSRDAEGKALRMIGTTTDITALRELAERLRQTVELVTNLTNEVPGLVFQSHLLPDGRSFFSYASKGLRDIYELEPEDVSASTDAIEALVHPQDLPSYRASLAASAADLTPWHLEYRVHLPRQGLRWRQGDARPQRRPDGSTLWHGFITDVTERKHVEAELHEFATIDVLTQLPNRRHFMAQVDAELARIRRDHDGPASILMCDLDHFKSINDRWGHAVGDHALGHFAAILRGELRKSDFAGRIGGEEFAVVLRGSDVAEARAFAQRVQRHMAAAPLMEGSQPIPLTISVGIAALRADDADPAAPLSRSDRALYRAKAAGRNRIESA